MGVCSETHWDQERLRLGSESPQHEEHHQATEPKPRPRIVGRLVCAGLIVLVVGWWGVYLVGGRWWIGDVLLNGSVFLGVGVGVASGIRLIVVRSWGSAALMAVCLSVLLMCMNGRRLVPLGADAGEAGSDYVKVVGLNMLMSNENPERLMRFLETLDDDVVVLVEPQWDVFDNLKNRKVRLDRYPHREFRVRDGLMTPPMMMLSRWEMARDESVEPWMGISVVVNRPESHGGRFRVVGLYVHSPRSAERWAYGNRVVDALIPNLIKLNRSDGMPCVIIGDLNGGPMTGRDRELRRWLGVERVSALFDPKSTFPAKMSMFGLLIDDIWVSDSVEGVSWSTVVIPGSDHHGVRAGLMVVGSTGS